VKEEKAEGLRRGRM